MNINAFILLTGCFVLATIGNGLQSSTIDSSLSSSYPFRDISEPIVKDDRFEKIIILSPLRVGSTLLYMVFQYLFEDQLEGHLSYNKKVVKSHKIIDSELHLIDDPNTYFIVPVRNPVDAFCSLVKTENKTKLTHNEIIDILNTTKKSYEELNKTLKKIDPKRILFFKYEEFNQDFSTIFKALEGRFQITISAEEQDKVNLLFSRDAVKHYFQKFRSFKEYDEILGVHGNHISSDRRTAEQLFSKKMLSKIYKELSPFFPIFGYETPKTKK